MIQRTSKGLSCQLSWTLCSKFLYDRFICWYHFWFSFHSMVFSLCRFSWFMPMSCFWFMSFGKVKQKSQWFLSLSSSDFCLMLLDVEELYSISLYILINELAVLVKFLGWSLLWWSDCLVTDCRMIFCSRAFQRFAVKTNRTLENLSSKAKEVREELSEQLKEARGEKDHFKQWSSFAHRFNKMILTILQRVFLVLVSVPFYEYDIWRNSWMSFNWWCRCIVFSFSALSRRGALDLLSHV